MTRRCCGGTGFVIRVSGEYAKPNGDRVKGARVARRCPRYVDYFRASSLMKDYPEKTPISRDPDACAAAVALHKHLAAKYSKAQEDGKAF